MPIPRPPRPDRLREGAGEPWPARRRFAAYRRRGRFRILRDLGSPLLPATRDAVVFLPPSYARSRRRYPVVYMHDGNNLFDPATSFCAQCWELERHLDALWAARGAAEFIVVGLHNTVDRHEEYTPTRDPFERQGGLGIAYLRFVAESVKPLVDRRFRTLPGPDHTGIAGSSLGGLISLYGGFAMPEIFGRVGAFSPSFWWDLRFAFHYMAMRAHHPFYRGLRVWLDMGTREGDGEPMCAEMIRELKRGGELLARAGFGPDRLVVHEAEGAEHNERFWGERSGRVFAFLFPPGRRPEAIAGDGGLRA